MAKISSTGKQFTLTIPKDIMLMMEWNKDTEVVIAKYPGKQILYIEEIKAKAKR